MKIAKGKVLFLVNILSFFASHRLPVAEALKANGFDVIIAYGELGNIDPKLLEKKGFKTEFTPMKRGGKNVVLELKAIYDIWRLFRKIRPKIVHLVAIKPYLYGGIIARLEKIPCVISAVAGLGILFIQNDLKSRIFRYFLYFMFKLALNHPNQKVILQNKEDLNFLINWKVLNLQKSYLINGSGVNLNKYINFDEIKGIPTISFVGRLIKIKGINDFVAAAKILIKKGVKAKFILAGDLDPENPSSLIPEDLSNLKKEAIVKILGYQNDMPKLFEKSHIVCLPSYREGLPKALAEAAAASRAIVTTDVPGCRDAIIPNKTGLLVPINNPKKLADALQRLIENREERIQMGRAGRELAKNKFDINKIINEHLKIYMELSN